MTNYYDSFKLSSCQDLLIRGVGNAFSKTRVLIIKELSGERHYLWVSTLAKMERLFLPNL